jgi:hypothetical protein
MIKILNFIFQNFWTWAGSMVILYIIVNFIIRIINACLRHRTLRKIGYPPPHCDSDGRYHNIGDIGDPADDEKDEKN